MNYLERNVKKGSKNLKTLEAVLQKLKKLSKKYKKKKRVGSDPISKSNEQLFSKYEIVLNEIADTSINGTKRV